MTNSLNLNCTYYYRFCEISSMMLDITELKTQNLLISNFIKLTMSQVAKLKSVYNTFIPKGILIRLNRWKGCKDMYIVLMCHFRPFQFTYQVLIYLGASQVQKFSTFCVIREHELNRTWKGEESFEHISVPKICWSFCLNWTKLLGHTLPNCDRP